MKVLAAHRAGLKTVILPKRNERDLEELPDEVRQTMNFLIVERIDQALDWALKLESEGMESPEFLAGARGEPLEPIVSLN